MPANSQLSAGLHVGSGCGTLLPIMNQDEVERTTEHVANAITAAPLQDQPFYHLQLANIFPADIYAVMLEAMPVKEDYRQMSGRTKSTRTMDGGGTRTKIDLFPEFVRHLPPEKKRVWGVVGRALCSNPVREAFRKKLAPGLEKRFG